MDTGGQHAVNWMDFKFSWWMLYRTILFMDRVLMQDDLQGHSPHLHSN